MGLRVVRSGVGQELAIDVRRMRWPNVSAADTPSSVCAEPCPMGHVRSYAVRWRAEEEHACPIELSILGRLLVVVVIFRTKGREEVRDGTQNLQGRSSKQAANFSPTFYLRPSRQF